VTVGLEFYE